jgi:hypothetical protein
MYPVFTPHPDIPLNIDSHPIPANPAKSEGAHWHHDFRYLAIASTQASLKPQELEVHDARWFPLQEFATWPQPDIRNLSRKIVQVLA